MQTTINDWVIVLVDDQLDNLAVAYEALTIFGATVHQARSAEEALKILQDLTPNLIITDLSMPDMDGYQLLTRIRAAAALRAVPVIALTAHAMTGDRERVLDAGFAGYLPKPLDILSLVPNIVNCLASHPAQEGGDGRAS